MDNPSSLDAELYADGITLTAALIERRTQDFGSVITEKTRDIGKSPQDLRTHLRSWYEGMRR